MRDTPFDSRFKRTWSGLAHNGEWSVMRGAATLLAAVALVIGSAPAHAAGTDPCPGAVIETQPIGEVGKEVGKLVVHYSPERNGTNCAATVATVETNEPKLMTVHLAKCKFSSTTTCDEDGPANEDKGSYKQYAGPVLQHDTKGKCISACGVIEYRGVLYTAATQPLSGHCQ
ncbi:hypothetical protein [Pyxidicoccus caerfyrddinensis]|uniref:hypothetical protein n=1 Tax=Pyxidicoccus caerfyrddinensis TaxID=2709663 RepID=UPI0013DCD1A0|nr:hypothetical protein [Pyxidicoccus caerfyrddinensis]